MSDDDNILPPLDPDELPEADDDLGLDDEGNPKKKPKDLIDDDTVSLEDETEDELDDDEEPFDDVNDQ